MFIIDKIGKKTFVAKWEKKYKKVLKYKKS